MDKLEELLELETFDRGGRDLWDGLADDRDPSDVQALVIEACRAKDTLDRLGQMAAMDTDVWARIAITDAGDLVVKIDAVLREQRQARIVFKQLLAEINRRRANYDFDEDDEGGLSDL